MSQRRLLHTALIPFIMAGVIAVGLGGCRPQTSHSPSELDGRSASINWSGQYEVLHPGCRFARGLELKSDGTYVARFFQGTMMVDGCGGPFVGDGQSLGSWAMTDQAVTFTPEKETSELIVSLRGARAERREDSWVLITSGDAPQELPLLKRGGPSNF